MCKFVRDVTTIFDVRSDSILQNDNYDDDTILSDLTTHVENVSLSHIRNNVLYYISSFIVFTSKSQCKYCQKIVLGHKPIDHTYAVDIKLYSSFTTFISEGKLCVPLAGVLKVIEVKK